MPSVPLHPALVHIPLGLALVAPVVTLVFAVGLWTERLRPRSWLGVVILFATLLGAGLVALKTGQNEETRVEAVVPESAIATHEGLAEQFLWVVGFSLLPAGTVLALRRPVAVRTGVVLVVVCSFVVAAAAIRVGRAGGKLVYVHNAARAYISQNAAGGEAKTSAVPTVDQTKGKDADND